MRPLPLKKPSKYDSSTSHLHLKDVYISSTCRYNGETCPKNKHRKTNNASISVNTFLAEKNNKVLIFTPINCYILHYRISQLAADGK